MRPLAARGRRSSWLRKPGNSVSAAEPDSALVETGVSSHLTPLRAGTRAPLLTEGDRLPRL